MSPRSQYAASGASHARFEHPFEEHRFEEDDAPFERSFRRDLAARDRFYAALLGALGGAVGGAGTLLVARALMLRSGSFADPAVTIGEHLPLQSSVPPQVMGLGIAMLVGAVIGAVLGRSTWRLTRFAPRVLFFAISLPAIWLCAQVLIIGHASHATASAFPFLPFLGGLLVYAFLVALIPLAHRPQHVEILPEKR